VSTNDLSGNTSDRRSELRSESERYHSVQFTTKSLASFYQFKLWNLSPKGMCILVKAESNVLKHIQVGDTLKMTYYLTDAQMGQEELKTQIMHITKSEDGRFQGHFMVGLAIL
jgi:hypothetical protein